MKKIWKVILGIVAVIYIGVAIFLTTCLLCYNKYGITVFDDTSLIIVEDDDLEPDYKKGDLVVVKKNKNDDIKVGDKIFFYNTYQNEISVNYGDVVKKEKVSEKETTFTLKGDSDFSSEYVIGKGETSKVYSNLGTVLSILESRVGFLVIIILPILLLFVYEIYAIIMEIKNEGKSKKKKQ